MAYYSRCVLLVEFDERSLDPERLFEVLKDCCVINYEDYDTCTKWIPAFRGCIDVHYVFIY